MIYQKGDPISSNRFLNAVMLLFFICLVFILSALFNPQLRLKVRSWFISSDRKILATLKEDIKTNGQLISVVKVKEKDKLYIEFYSIKKKMQDETEEVHEAPFILLQKIELPGSIDGYVNFTGQATNLAVANLDEDPYLELIVPYYSSEFSANLEVIKYNSDLDYFELVNNFDISKSLLENVTRSQE